MPVYGMRGVKVARLPEWAVNPEPEVYADWTEAAKQMFNTYQGYGETILWCTGRYSDGHVARFVVLNPGAVNIEWAEGERQYSLAGEPLDRADICHFKYQSYPMNLRGIGPLEWSSRNLLSASALESAATNLASRGGIPWAVIKHPRHLNGPEATELQERWVSAAQRRSGAPAVLSGGIELQPLTISPREMALIEMRIFDEGRIAAALGVPPYLVGLPQPEGGMTYANVNAIFDFHWRATLRPMARAAATAMSLWLLPRGTDLEFNRDEYVKPPMLERAQTYATLHGIMDEKGNHAITVDEIRLSERFIPNQPIDAEETQGVLL
jgi:HK97 family phage portal protein